ncbi:hypothetical protein F4780DRAFT_232269 [Xylariomycetidae sp. FL0641]|nr:hypothetical protein F4780DRAFT_232269 [Xylariomycetidae sp. FL0641]
MSSSPYPFPDLPSIGLKFPPSPAAAAAFAYTQQHTSAAVANHCARSAYWALLLAKHQDQTRPPQAAADPEAVVLACLLHDLGWAAAGLGSELVTPDRRFEVDGANAARAFLRGWMEREGGKGEGEVDEHRLQRVWDAVALHTTASIAAHAAPEVALAHAGIMADFAGPRWPGGGISPEAYREVVRLFPFAGFGVDLVTDTLCGLCRDKPASTYDNIAAGFGCRYGLDGKGKGKEQYMRDMAEATDVSKILAGLKGLEELVKEEEEEEKKA